LHSKLQVSAAKAKIKISKQFNLGLKLIFCSIIMREIKKINFEEK